MFSEIVFSELFFLLLVGLVDSSRIQFSDARKG